MRTERYMQDIGVESQADPTDRQVLVRLRRRERELEAARRISQTLFKPLRLEDVLKQSLGMALETVGAEAGAIFIARPESEELVFHHAIGEKSPPLGTAFSWDDGIAGAAFQTGEAIVVGNVQHDSRHFGDLDRRFDHVTRDLIALPLKRWDGDPIGVLEVMNKKSGSLNYDDVSILTIISAFTAISIEQARLFEEAKLSEVARLLGDISHDIKNMMMPITYGAWLLQKKFDGLFGARASRQAELTKSDQADGQKILSMIRNNARLIQERVKEITDAVKGLSSPLRFRPCNIVEVVTTVTETLHPLADERGISLRTENLRSLPSIQADERRLFNALYNLINNAIDEVARGGSITIRGFFESDAQLVNILIIDTGGGMSPEVRASLFTKQTISRKTGGTGLGTKIVKDAVDAHGGHISVESQIGVGTTFHIRLPLHSSSTRVR